MRLIPILAIISYFLTPGFAHAYHVYGSYSCKYKNFNLNYDGPGSNYAVGGHSHFYLNNKSIKALAFDISQEEDSTAALGDTAGDEKLEILFSRKKIKQSKSKSDLSVGGSCEPNDVEYQTVSWTSKTEVKIEKISEAAQKKFNLKPGDVKVFSCEESMGIPVRCPKTGKYAKDNLHDVKGDSAVNTSRNVKGSSGSNNENSEKSNGSGETQDAE